MAQKLLFVYNADATLFAAASDFAKRLLTPEEYQCNLCMVTFGTFGNMKEEWKEFIESLDIPVLFLHRDGFKRDYPGNDTPLPAMFTLGNGEPEVLVTRAEIDAVETIPEMIALVQSKLA